MKNSSKPITINSISELHRIAEIGKPLHPMVSLISFSDTVIPDALMDTKAVFNLYSIFLKKNIKGKLQYGQSHYDFDEGVLGMNAPGQLMRVQDQYEAQGWWLIFHPDFIQGYPLAKAIKSYGFFSYAVSEALHLSAKEETLIENIFHTIAQEYNTSIDIHAKLIEEAKEKLSTTDLSVSEIAFQLGFEHSQSFSKMFKSKTNLSPSEFRQSFN